MVMFQELLLSGKFLVQRALPLWKELLRLLTGFVLGEEWGCGWDRCPSLSNILLLEVFVQSMYTLDTKQWYYWKGLQKGEMMTN